MDQAEEWRDIARVDEHLPVGDVYEASSHGRIRKKGGDLVALVEQHGYLVVRLNLFGWQKNFKVHRLIAATFLGQMPSPEAQVNHISGIKTDNRACNLEWVTPVDNVAHARENGLLTLGSRRKSAKLTEQDVVAIRHKRACGVKLKALADEFGVSEPTIKALLYGRSWKHL